MANEQQMLAFFCVFAGFKRDLLLLLSVPLFLLLKGMQSQEVDARTDGNKEQAK